MTSPSQLNKDVKLLRSFVDAYERGRPILYSYHVDAVDRIISGFEFAGKHKDDA